MLQAVVLGAPFSCSVGRIKSKPTLSFTVASGTNSYPSYLAIVSALITIAAVAIDSFSQQVIHYQSCQRVDPDNAARVSMTNKYTYSGPGALIAPEDPRELEGDIKYYPSDCAFTMDSALPTPLESRLQTAFFGDDINTYAGLKTFVGAMDDNLLLNVTGGDLWWQNFFRNGTADLTHINTTLNRLTDSMTAVIRQRGDSQREYYFSGVTWTTQTCIRVQWEWLILPAALLVSAIAFFVTIALKTRRWQRTWKSSSLPLPPNGFSGRPRERYGKLSFKRWKKGLGKSGCNWPVLSPDGGSSTARRMQSSLQHLRLYRMTPVKAPCRVH